MAVKARNRKRRQKEEMMLRAVRIKCCYCDIKDTCIRREGKEKDEKLGRRTSCTLTPNIPRSKSKQLAKARKGK